MNGNIYKDNALIMAPLSGYTDLPYRRSLRRHGCRYAFSEMIDAASLAFSNTRCEKMLVRGDDEDFLGVQLVGANPEWIAKSVNILNTHDFDVLDFNLGCPVPKVAKKGAGAVLAQDLDAALKVFDIMVSRSKVPVSAKIRILDENDPEPTLKLAKGLEDGGARALTIHGRVRKVFYSGEVFSDIIREVRNALSIPVIANGGVVGLDSYDQLREQSNCREVMLARGAMGNPWIFSELGNNEFRPPSLSELYAEIEQHVIETADFHGEELGFKLCRKIIIDYLRGRGFPGTLRAKISFLKSYTGFADFMREVRNNVPAEAYWQQVADNPRMPRRLSPRDDC